MLPVELVQEENEVGLKWPDNNRIFNYKIKHMTGYQQQLFSDLLNLNWEADNTSNSPFMRDVARNQYWKVKEELIEEMGKEEYERFIRIGREMFAPAKQDDYNNDPELSMHIDDEEWEKENGR